MAKATVDVDIGPFVLELLREAYEAGQSDPEGDFESWVTHRFTDPRVIEIENFEMTCSGCPMQWQGDSPHGYVYVRVRHGYWRVCVDGDVVVDGETSDGVDGICDWSDVVGWAADKGVRLKVLSWV
jgi:hypothetical protein